EMKSCATRIQHLRWEFIDLFWCYFDNWVVKRFMPRVGAKISTQETLLSFTILDCLLHQSTSIAIGRVAPVDVAH
ncbi:hypothetical protein HAX54_026383, partial [Datura stramonium]|nr:hypothetical protein [Datura stramonium]